MKIASMLILGLLLILAPGCDAISQRPATVLANDDVCRWRYNVHILMELNEPTTATVHKICAQWQLIKNDDGRRTSAWIPCDIEDCAERACQPS